MEIFLDASDVRWAVESASTSLARWSGQAGYYPNQFSSHFKGRLGELAVEKYLLQNGRRLDSHFRFVERENLCDLVIKLDNSSNLRRVEVKTWDALYWPELGRCISVEQYPNLKKKADVILWCVVAAGAADRQLKQTEGEAVLLIGWSTLLEISSAPIRETGVGKMRKIRNYQLGENDVHTMEEFPW